MITLCCMIRMLSSKVVMIIVGLVAINDGRVDACN